LATRCRAALEVDGEGVWCQRRRFEVPAELTASPYQELQIESGTGDFKFAGALCFPKFVKGGAASPRRAKLALEVGARGWLLEHRVRG